MRLLYLGDTGSPHFRGWASHFADAGHDVHVMHLAFSEAGEPIPAVTSHPAPAVKLGTRALWRLSAASIRRLHRRLRPDVVHSHPVAPCGYLVEAARVSPHVSTAWGSEVLLASETQRRRLRTVAEGAELLTAPSQQLLAALESAGADRGRLRWVPWGISREWRHAADGVDARGARRRLGLPPDRPLVLSPRGTRRLYRQDTFLRAFARVRAERGDPVAVISGPLRRDEAAADAAQLRRLAAELGISEHVIFRESFPHHEMPLAYRAADACVSVPESDGAPVSVLEAMAIGVPLVVSQLPWAEDPVYREARIRRVPVGDHVALAEQIGDLLDGGEDADREANRDLVERFAARENCLGAFEAEYERLAAA